MEADDDLLRKCQAGDAAALARLVGRFQERVFRLACRVTGDAGLGEEAAVAAFAKVWAKAGQWRGESSAGTWIYRVAWRAIIDCQRARRRWWRLGAASVPAEWPDPQPGPAEVVEAADERVRLARIVTDALEQLSHEDRGLVHLYYFERLGLAEIADILGASRDALKMRLARARERLRSLLKGFDDRA